jgi:serine protease Do
VAIVRSTILSLACSLLAMSCRPAPSSSFPASPAIRVEPNTTRSPAEIAKNATPAVVSIRTEEALGTGFIVAASGLVATNLHVVAGHAAIMVTLTDQREFRVVEVWNGDKDKDLVVLRIQARGLPVLSLGDSSQMHPGDAVVAIGHPLGLEDTVSNGLISAIRKVDDELTILQISAPIAPGSSGGPIFNDRGEVIGVSTAILMGGQNLNFGVPVAYLKQLLEKPAPVSVDVFARATASSEKGAKTPSRHIPHLPVGILNGCAPASIALILSTIGDAMDVGASLYNDGNVAGCYHVYEGAASDLERRLATSCQKPARAISDGRKRAARLVSMQDRAWAMRDTFESLLDVIDRAASDPRAGARPRHRR